MAIGVVTYDGFRLPSLLDVNPRETAFYFDDFVADLGNDTVTQATAGTGAHITNGSEDGGIYKIDAASATDGQGPNIQFKTFAVTPTAGKNIFFECGITFKDEPLVDMFIGLSAVNTTILIADDTDPDAIGFVSFEDSAIDATTRVDDTASGLTVTRDVGTVTVDTFTKFAIAIHGTDKASYYINDALVATTTTNLPNTAVVPSIVLHACAAGTAQPEARLDYLYCMKDR